MFYMKHRGKRLKIRDDNVFTICPDCGREFAVDIQEVLREADTDLYSTQTYCDDCTAERVCAVIAAEFFGEKE